MALFGFYLPRTIKTSQISQIFNPLFHYGGTLTTHSIPKSRDAKATKIRVARTQSKPLHKQQQPTKSRKGAEAKPPTTIQSIRTNLEVKRLAGGGADALLPSAERAEVLRRPRHHGRVEFYYDPPLHLAADGDIHEAPRVFHLGRRRRGRWFRAAALHYDRLPQGEVPENQTLDK